MINKIIFFLFFLIFFLINSCDDNTIIFDSGESGINYFENSFVIDLEKSSFSSIPKYHINDSLLNQGLVPKLYIGIAFNLVLLCYQPHYYFSLE